MSEATTAETSAPTTEAGNAPTDDQTANTAAATTTPEQTPPAEQPAETPEKVVPESYDLKMPEGISLDEAAAKEFTDIAKEAGLSAEQAQKFADVVAKMAQRQAEQHAALVASWADNARADKEFGGDKFSENLAVAKTALDKFASPELKAFLDATGFGNHPELIRAFYWAGKAISEDGFTRGSAASTEGDPAKKLFPSMN